MKVLRRLRSLFQRTKIDSEMTEEMRQHVELQTELNRKAGMTATDARNAALRQFGNVASIQERAREARGWVWLEQVGQDLAYTVRQLGKTPAFTATVIGTLALGIGACTVVFTAIHTTLLHPSDAPEPERQVLIHETQLPQIPQMQLSIPNFQDVQRQAKSFEVLTGWTRQTVHLRGNTEPFELSAMMATPHASDYWGVYPFLGRLFGEADYAPGAPRVVVLGHSLWQRAFGADTAVIGRSINIDDTACTVIGVMTPRFARFGSDLELFMPLVLENHPLAANRAARILQTQGVLKRGVTVEQAQAEMGLIATGLARQYPDINKGGGLLVRNFGTYLNRNMRPMLAVLLGAVGCVLLIACANVANLLLARATVRQREMAVRAALGAGRGRIMRQLLVESLLLAALGGGAGIVLASWGLRFIRIYGPSAGTDMARLAFVELEPSVLGFTLGFSLLTGLVFGLAPAWLGSRVDLNEALKHGSRGSSEGGIRGGLRRMLVVLEVALALVLLAGAGLLVRSFAQLAQIDPGIAVERVAAMRVILNSKKYAKPAQRIQFTDDLLARLRALPGVEAATLSNQTPFDPGSSVGFGIAGRPAGASPPRATAILATPDYFKALGVRLARGRTFNAQDGVTGPPVFVINETFARQNFPDEDPLGRVLQLKLGNGTGPAGEIVGIVADTIQGDPGAPRPPQFYLPWAQLGGSGFYVMVRTAGDPAAFLSQLKAPVFALDPDQPVGSVRTLQSLMADRMAGPLMMLRLLGAFALMALLIAGVGIYGVMAYLVSQRTTEFGIRMALGASRGDVLRQVLRQGLGIVAVGLAAGLAAALLLGRVVQSLLVETSPRDPLTLAAIVGLLFAVSFLACLLPARRATKVDPMIALRAE